MMKTKLAAAALFALTPTVVPAADIVVAGGCFWCVEADFDKLNGVSDTVSGYTGGTTPNPTYDQVTGGNTGHYEAVKISYDPAVLPTEDLLTYFLRTVDVTDDGGQFCDRGSSYRTAIFVATPEERAVAEKVKAEAEAALDQTVVTPILDAATFTVAEDYHQNYYQSDARALTRFGVITRADAYERYRQACGRDQRVRQVWGDQAFTK
ncbi:peptide-methionine (S)-S-oxide reductase MsrA [Paracoccaceae bacterium GXU_MW_L88]